MTFEVRDPTAVIRRRFPALEFQEVRVVEDGWDSLVLELDATWMLRFPRRSEVAQWLEQEIALLPELAPSLPVEIPRFDLIARNGVLCVGYRKLIGEPAHDLSAPAGADLARFLSALHRFPAARARDLGIPGLPGRHFHARGSHLRIPFGGRPEAQAMLLERLLQVGPAG